MPSPSFKSRKQWFRWYSTIYLKCHWWRNVVRPSVFQYRKGMCHYCGKKITNNYWNCHHGEGMYKHLGDETKYLDRMFVLHVSCHKKVTRKERLKRTIKRLF